MTDARDELREALANHRQLLGPDEVAVGASARLRRAIDAALAEKPSRGEQALEIGSYVQLQDALAQNTSLREQVERLTKERDAFDAEAGRYHQHMDDANEELAKVTKERDEARAEAQRVRNELAETNKQADRFAERLAGFPQPIEYERLRTALRVLCKEMGR